MSSRRAGFEIAVTVTLMSLVDGLDRHVPEGREVTDEIRHWARVFRTAMDRNKSDPEMIKGAENLWNTVLGDWKKEGGRDDE